MTDLEERISTLRTWSRSEQRAPHKPLLMLWALARVQRAEPRLSPWLEVEPALTRLLEDFGPPRQTYHPEHPFWRLQRDRVWEVTGPSGEPLKGVRENPSGDVGKVALRDAHAMGGLPDADYLALAAAPCLVNRLAAVLLASHFPSSLHEELLDAVCFPFVPEIRFRPKRYAGFRDEVLQGYDYRCAVCDLSLQLGGKVWGVEAAHVRWHAAHGPDSFENGLALCVLHHKALDRGAIGLDDERHIVVSRKVSSSPSANTWLIDYHGKRLREPQAGLPRVAPAHIAWHNREVFRRPGR